METLLIRSENKSNLRLIREVAEKIGEKVEVLTDEEAEDLAFGAMMQQAKTGKLVSKETILQELWK